jgi:hypothetical protein
MHLDYAGLALTPPAGDPFPHIVVPHFVPAEDLDTILGDLPAMAKRGSFPIGALRLGPTARALAQELEGPYLRNALASKFGLDLGAAATMLTLRGRSGPQDGRIHCDSTAKRVTVLVYLNRSTDAWTRHQGCLRLLRSPASLDDYAVEVPPVDGTLLAFPNSPAAWHGHHPFVGPRAVLQLNYMTNSTAARSELRRHRISAFFKRLTAAA